MHKKHKVSDYYQKNIKNKFHNAPLLKQYDKDLIFDDNCIKKRHKHSKFFPLFYVFAFIMLLSSTRQFTMGFDSMMFMMDFMGTFFLVFGLLKFYDLKGFVRGFQSYDIIAKKIPVFGYIYPFIEVFLGIMYLAGFMFLWQSGIALILSGLGLYSAHIMVRKRETVYCVCLGSALGFPVTNVTVIENAVMFTMILFMLIT